MCSRRCQKLAREVDVDLGPLAAGCGGHGSAGVRLDGGERLSEQSTDRLVAVKENKMTENLLNVATTLGLAATCLVGALTILVLALASKIVKETRRQGRKAD